MSQPVTQSGCSGLGPGGWPIFVSEEVSIMIHGVARLTMRDCRVLP